MDTYDVAIIGAGPAGMACALSLAHYNLKIALIEKRPIPISKPCGESILPAGVELLKNLGVLEHLDHQLFHVIRGIHYKTKNCSAKADFFDGVGLGIHRSVLSQAFALTLRNKCIDVIHGEFLGFSQGIVSLKNNLQCKAGFLIGADGLRSSVRHALGITEKKPLFRRYALTAHISLKPWSSLVEIYLHNGIEAYVTPTGPKEVNIVVLWSPTHKHHGKGNDLFFALLNQFPELINKIRIGTLLHKPYAVGPFHHRVKHMYCGTTGALIGDAAGYIDPLTGEGMSIGIHQGIMLADRIGKKLALKETLTIDQLKLFEHDARRHARPHSFLTYGLLLAQKSPLLFDRALDFFNQHPQFLSALTALSMGKQAREIAKFLFASSNFFKPT